MRYIRTLNNIAEFIESDSTGKILSARGFQFGEVYFQIKNSKVTFYLNDQENPFRNDVWYIDIPFTMDGVEYATEDEASAALHAVFNDRFQEQLDELKEGLAAETARAQEAEEQLNTKIDNETSRAISAETHLQDEVTSLSGLVATFDERITRNTNDISALTDDLNDEITRSVAEDLKHDTLISGLTTNLQAEIERATEAETIIIDDLNDEILRSTNKDTEHDTLISGMSIDIDDIIEDLQAEINRSVTKDAEHDYLISGFTGLVEAETARAKEAEAALQTSLTTEITRSITKDAELEANISAFTRDLENEIDRATNREDEIEEDVEGLANRVAEDEASIGAALVSLNCAVTEISGNSKDIEDALQAEILRSTTKDASHDTLISGLTTNLQSEIERATEAENDLRDDLNAEIVRSTEKDTSHDEKISAITTNLQAEITRATEAENSLRNDLNAEILRASTKETELSTKISGLSDDIDDEIARATARENEVETKVDRLSGETYVISGTLSTKINEIETKIIEVSGDTYTKEETDAKLALKQNKLSAGTGINITDDNVISATGEIDAYTKAETDAKLNEKVNIADNEVPAYIGKGTTEYSKYFPAYGETATTWSDMLEGAYIKAGKGSGNYPVHSYGTSVVVKDESGNSYSESVTWASSDHVDRQEIADEEVLILTAKEGYKIAYIQSAAIRYDGDSYIDYNNSIYEYGTLFEGGQSADVIETELEPAIVGKQDKLSAGYGIVINAQTNEISTTVSSSINQYGNYPVRSSVIYNALQEKQDVLSAGTGIDITNDVISVTGGSAGVVDSALSTTSENPVQNKVITNAINNVYTKTEVDNKISAKIWCGTQSEYDAISVKDPNKLYLIHD